MSMIWSDGEVEPMERMKPEELKRIRESINMLQSEFGKELGYGKAAQIRVSELENGKRPIPKWIARIARIMEQRVPSPVFPTLISCRFEFEPHDPAEKTETLTIGQATRMVKNCFGENFRQVIFDAMDEIEVEKPGTIILRAGFLRIYKKK